MYRRFSLPGIIHHGLWLLLFLAAWLISGVEISNVVYWPGAYFLSLWTISLGVPLLRPFKADDFFPGITKNLILAFGFGVIHFLLYPFLTLLLERLFRLQDHFILSELPTYYYSNTVKIVEGMGWYGLYIVISTCYRGMLLWNGEKERTIMRNAKISQSQLENLNLQWQPHFIFNAMNSISMLVRKEENKKAVKMIANLNDLFRESLQTSEKIRWTVEEEVDLIRKYVDIEKIRFGDRVDVEMRVEEKDKSVFVPRGVLQPIVENAFKHGVANTLGNQLIRVTIKQIQNKLKLEVFNTGEVKDWMTSSQGIGLANVQRKLMELYGSNYHFQVESLGDGMICSILFPYHE